MIQLLTMLGTGFTGVVGSVLAFIARKVGTATATIGAFVLMTTAFIACINVILQNVLALMSMPLWVSGAVGMFIPANFAAVLAAVTSSWICRAAYDLTKFKIKVINNAS